MKDAAGTEDMTAAEGTTGEAPMTGTEDMTETMETDIRIEGVKGVIPVTRTVMSSAGESRRHYSRFHDGHEGRPFAGCSG